MCTASRQQATVSWCSHECCFDCCWQMSSNSVVVIAHCVQMICAVLATSGVPPLAGMGCFARAQTLASLCEPTSQTSASSYSASFGEKGSRCWRNHKLATTNGKARLLFKAAIGKQPFCQLWSRALAVLPGRLDSPSLHC